MKLKLGVAYLLLLLATLFPAVFLRAALIIGQGIAPLPIDLRGLLSDLLIATLVFAPVAWMFARTRLGALLLMLFWCLLNYGNYEHISTLGAAADIGQVEYLFNETFFKGSVLRVSSPFTLLFVCGGTMTLLAFAAGRRRSSKPAVTPYALFAALGLVVLSQVPTSVNALDWRQGNFVYENVARLLRRSAADEQGGLRGHYSGNLRDLFSRDLSGTPIIELAGKKRNVLLIMLEGISGVHLESLAQVHGIDNSVKLPALDRLARSNLAYSTFVSHNRQTNRGEYAILCGDLPMLLDNEPKMTSALSRPDISCLPDILRRAGYHTVYLQAAPMGFMSKDSFMPMAGYNESYGETWFKDSYARNQWGIDDRAFLLQSTEKIVQLQNRTAPWMLTLLTVGTHHPYIVPAHFGDSNFPQAAAYMDAAFAEFIEKITSMGVLEDTLVIITSDESVGITGYRGASKLKSGQGVDDVTRKLVDNWGFVIVLTPQRSEGRVDEPFAQVDLPISVLDYLGLSAVPNEFIGRSIFRRYGSGRPIVFGNVYKKYLGVFDADGAVTLCRQDLAAGCEHFTVPAGALFSPRREAAGSDPAAEKLLASVLAVSADRRPPERVIPLAPAKVLPLQAARGMQVLFGGQYLATPAHSKISVAIDVELEGSVGDARFSLLAQSGAGTIFSRTLPALQVGDRLQLAFDYYSPVALNTLAVIGTVSTSGEAGMQLHFSRAALAISPVAESGWQPSARLSLRELEVVRRE